MTLMDSIAAVKNEIKPYRVLISDDQPDVLEALRLLLKGQGWQAVTADSPKALLDTARGGPEDRSAQTATPAGPDQREPLPPQAPQRTTAEPGRQRGHPVRRLGLIFAAVRTGPAIRRAGRTRRRRSTVRRCSGTGRAPGQRAGWARLR